jgi:hypothetical protein
VEAARSGFYIDESGNRVDWSKLVESARAARVSIPPAAVLSASRTQHSGETRVQVANETTLSASRQLVEEDLRPVALNFANGVMPGGGFCSGARAQEEVLCRSSALHATLEHDPMYSEHRKRSQPDSTDWAIYSPDVPVFRTDGGRALARPWLLSFISCAAPYAPKIGQPAAGDLLEKRIQRSVRGAVVPSATTPTGQHETSDNRWRESSLAHSPGWSSPSQTGRQTGDSWGLSERFSRLVETKRPSLKGVASVQNRRPGVAAFTSHAGEGLAVQIGR